jgi:hypothetical protein
MVDAPEQGIRGDIALSRYPAVYIFQLIHAFGVLRCQFVRLAALVGTRTLITGGFAGIISADPPVICG